MNLKTMALTPVVVLLPLLLLCALNGADGTGIVGGRNAEPHSRPYMASLQIRGRLSCGGSLIREDFVLTAAHCLLPIPYTVVLGADTLSGNEPTRQQFTVARAIPHPGYDGFQNDIMLLKLNGSAQINSAVQLLPLNMNRIGARSRCITAGWGDIGDNRTIADRLQEVNVTTLSQRACRSRWGRGRVTIATTMVCGVGGAAVQGFCSGDSGGPLVCDGAAAGVVSFSGRRCGNPRTPDVYTRVSSFTDWITTVINNN